MAKGKKKTTYYDNLVKRSEDARIVRRVVSVLIFIFIMAMAYGGYKTYDYIASALQPVDPTSDEEIHISIPMGSSVTAIANILEENGVIKDARIFRYYLKFKNEYDFQAGDYVFTPASTFTEIIETLKSGKIVLEPIYTVTIPEGKTIDEIAEIYSNILPIEKEAFLERVNDPEYIKELIHMFPAILTEDILHEDIRTPLEGYLFAATYDFYEEEPSVDTIVEMMLEKTDEVVSAYHDQIAEKSFTVHEAITFASLLEKEAKTYEQRKKIAGVFYNRLEQGMKLQTDPTVLYALGEHKDRVLYSDLEIKSPYNTYYVHDLPIGPISNFNENALEAALNPEETDYLYFLHDRDGNIHYAKTLDEHNRLKEQYINEG